MKWFVTDAHWAAQGARHAPEETFVAHLRAEVEYWRTQWEHERQRTEVAIDQCRVTHLHIGPVSLPPRPTTAPPEPPTLEQLLRETELGAIGQSDGVAR